MEPVRTYLMTDSRNVAKGIRFRRFGRMGHVVRMLDSRNVLEILTGKPSGNMVKTFKNCVLLWVKDLLICIVLY